MRLVGVLSAVIYSPLVYLANFVGTFACVLLSGLWIHLGRSRARVARAVAGKRQQAHESGEKQEKFGPVWQERSPPPPIAVVLPCSGKYDIGHITDVWTSQLSTEYAGDAHFVFVCESTVDPAYATLCGYFRSFLGAEMVRKDYGYDVIPASRFQQPALVSPSDVERSAEIRGGASPTSLCRLPAESPALASDGGLLASPNQAEEARRAIVSPASKPTVRVADRHKIYLLTSGLSFHGSQKIHNIVYGSDFVRDRLGIRTPGEGACPVKYFVFLDDDIRVHGSTLTSLVSRLEQDEREAPASQSPVVATGYSVETPVFHASGAESPGRAGGTSGPRKVVKPERLEKSGGRAAHAHARKPPFADYLITVYRSINLAGFLTDRPAFVWGGCMCIPARVMYAPISSFAAQASKLADESRADDSRPLSDNASRGLTLRDIWVDGCYSEDMTLGNLVKSYGGRILAPLDCMFVNALPQGHTFWRSYVNYVQRQYYVLTTYSSDHDRGVNLVALLQLLVVGILINIPILLIAAELLAHLATLALGVPAGGAPNGWKFPAIWSLNLVLASLLLLAVSHDHMVRSLVGLCNTLSKEKDPVRPALNPIKTMVALVLHCMLMPVLAGSVLCMRTIRWGAVFYTKERGRVSRVRRLDSEAGEESAKESLSAFLRTGRGVPDQRELKAVVKQVEVERDSGRRAGFEGALQSSSSGKPALAEAVGE